MADRLDGSIHQMPEPPAIIPGQSLHHPNLATQLDHDTGAGLDPVSQDVDLRFNDDRLIHHQIPASFVGGPNLWLGSNPRNPRRMDYKQMGLSLPVLVGAP
jgi:hypothetical protein